MNLKEWIDAERGRGQKVAQALGCTRMNVSHMTSGKTTPSIEQTNILHELTGLSIQELNPELAKAIESMKDET